MPIDKQKLENSSKYSLTIIILSSIVLLILFLGGAYKFSISLLELDKIEVKSLSGEVYLVHQSQSTKLTANQTYSFSTKDTLILEDSGVALLLFPSGRTLTLSDKSKYSFTLNKNFENEKVYIFSNDVTGESFSYNELKGLDKANTTAISDSDEQTNSQVLGVKESTNPIEAIDAFCENDKSITNIESNEQCKRDHYGQ